MKKYIFTAFASLILLASPALADHHQGAADHQNQPAHGEQHSHDMQAVLKDSQTFAKRAIDVLMTGNKLLEQGQVKKDPKLMLKGSQLIQKGHAMHKQSMHALGQMQHQLKHHLMHAKVGDMQIPEAQMTEMQAQLKAMQEFIGHHHHQCQAEMSKIPAKASILIAFADQILEQALKSNNLEQIELASQVLEAGMQLHMLQSHGMMGMQDDMSDKMSGPMMQKEVEVRIRQH